MQSSLQMLEVGFSVPSLGGAEAVSCPKFERGESECLPRHPFLSVYDAEDSPSMPTFARSFHPRHDRVH